MGSSYRGLTLDSSNDAATQEPPTLTRTPLETARRRGGGGLTCLWVTKEKWGSKQRGDGGGGAVEKHRRLSQLCSGDSFVVVRRPGGAELHCGSTLTSSGQKWEQTLSTERFIYGH